mmetsp:Transcript_54457/g.105221  ORF Transcript_54457/g.105221 Transcript_54457/m.105221 type:complete len:277 (-) Transcript_54457:236-1066(-)
MSSRMRPESSMLRTPALSIAQVRPFRSVARSSIFAEPSAQHEVILRMTSAAREFISPAFWSSKTEKAHAQLDRPLASNSAMCLAVLADITATSSGCCMWILANAQHVLAKSRQVHSPIFSMVRPERVHMRSSSSIRNVAKAHKVLERFCGSNSAAFARASSDMAVMRSSNFWSILANAQEVLASPCGPNSAIFLVECSTKASIFSVIVKLRVAMDQTVFAKFCAPNSSIRPMVVPQSASISCSLLFVSFAQDQIMFARWAGWNSAICCTAAPASFC